MGDGAGTVFAGTKGEDLVGKYRFESTKINGLWVIEPTVFGDDRGYFMETYTQRDFEQAGIDAHFVQDNQSSSRKGVLRGLHYQKCHPQSKLVRVIKGEVFDVAVDLRHASPTRGQWYATILSAENHRQMFIPHGFAHGFLVLSDMAEFTYKCDDYYHPEDEAGYAWNDPSFAVDWPDPGCPLILSDKDRAQPFWQK